MNPRTLIHTLIRVRNLRASIAWLNAEQDGAANEALIAEQVAERCDELADLLDTSRLIRTLTRSRNPGRLRFEANRRRAEARALRGGRAEV
ncbi:hypothetical protein [Actinoplanes sp. HUAS TT8]|uniref:hypothetical protein n=1 Tax=Actinoplanes sp. HUAS TT8 TaxID=3447453 RepID=UPI003F52630A